jgi:hypothetical protein
LIDYFFGHVQVTTVYCSQAFAQVSLILAITYFRLIEYLFGHVQVTTVYCSWAFSQVSLTLTIT